MTNELTKRKNNNNDNDMKQITSMRFLSFVEVPKKYMYCWKIGNRQVIKVITVASATLSMAGSLYDCTIEAEFVRWVVFPRVKATFTR